MIVELHFQDGFSGESIEVLVDGEVRAVFTAKTRYQINLAHIAEVDLKPGQELAIRVENAGDTIKLPSNGTSKYYVISKNLEQIVVKRADNMPGYL
jgi:hypothetical protein